MKLIAFLGFLFGLIAYIFQSIVFVTALIASVSLAINTNSAALLLLGPAFIAFAETSFSPMAIMLLSAIVFKVSRFVAIASNK